jgi:hypothetical protein
LEVFGDWNLPGIWFLAFGISLRLEDEVFYSPLATRPFSLFTSAAMQRPVIWFILVALLLGVLSFREPRLEKAEEAFLQWLLRNSEPHGPKAPLTVVEIGQDANLDPAMESASPSQTSGRGVSPLEFALFLQSVLEFQPTVVAFENILKWRERDRDQEQVFIDQAMRVPRLLLAAELTATPDPDAPGPEIPGFTQVTGKRGDLVEFSGVGRQPNEEMRLIATPGFINLPDEVADRIHIPLLFRYRGEVIPSFALQAVLLWLRAQDSDSLGWHTPDLTQRRKKSAAFYLERAAAGDPAKRSGKEDGA